MKMILFSLIFFLFPVVPLLAQTGDQTGRWGWHPMMNWWGFPMGFMMLIPVVVVILLLWPLFKGAGRQELPSVRAETALDIIQKRYARGEISREEYLSMKDDLEK